MARFLLALLFLGLGLFHAALAAPEQYPEVIPGPGLPSLAELNLTSADLYTRPMPDVKALLARNPTLNRRYEPRCGPSEDAYANATEIIACFHLLLNLPRSTKCGASRVLDGNSYCKSGSSEIAVFSQSGNWTVSTCYDVAYGALWVIDHCTRPDNTCAGFQAAWDNGDLIVAAVKRDWFGNYKSP